MTVIENVKELSDEEFIEKYRKLVHHIIRKNFLDRMPLITANTSLEYDDLFQIGLMALWRARERFKPSYGYSFTSFAVPWVKGVLQRSLREQNKIKASRTILDLRYRIANGGLSDFPISEIADKLDVGEDAVEEAILYNPGYLHLGSLKIDNNGDGKDVTFEETIPDDFQLDEYVSNNQVLRDFFNNVLSEKEKQVWYLCNIKGLRQMEVSRILGMSQTYVSRLLHQVNEKAEKYGKRQGLRS